MTGSAAGKAADAADALLGWLSSQEIRRTASSSGVPPETGVAAGSLEYAPTEPQADPAVVRPQGTIEGLLDRQPDHPTADTHRTMRLPTPDWLHHRLTISGTAAEVGRFRQAAAGAGVIPWHLDLERLEEGYFHLLVASENRSLSVAGARIFARQLRDAVGRRHDLATACVGHSQACPFDLHALLPVPTEILLLGPDEPRALAWLWEHWGTTEALRLVAEEIDRVPAYPSEGDGPEEHLRVSFWSADWTPWRALKHLESIWPALRFDIRRLTTRRDRRLRTGRRRSARETARLALGRHAPTALPKRRPDAVGRGLRRPARLAAGDGAGAQDRPGRTADRGADPVVRRSPGGGAGAT